jgi:DNA-binding winged helix-turn-helix (wHTH) protein
MSDTRRGTSEVRTIHRRVWRFAGCELDEGHWRLSVRGQPVQLEIKPLELLLEFLRRPEEVLTKDELLDAVWPGTLVVEGSLTTAISKLRRALDDADQSLLVTVPRIGYRLAAKVEVAASEAARPSGLALEAGQTVPGRPQWRLVRALGQSRANDVWLTEHAKTGEHRVFKFANDPGFLRNLKREVAVSRLLAATLGERPDFAPALEWNFDAQPFFVEIAYRGQDLPAWAERQGGLQAVGLETRQDLAIQVAETMAAAHGLGVLHQDLKPANVVVSARPGGGWQAAVVDFGSADVIDGLRLAELKITHDGFGAPDDSGRNRSGTPLYMAPEVLAGGPPSALSDIYALGVVLYQLTAGDLGRPMAAGWERDINDPLLREDIAEAASGDPQRRLASARELANRLRTMDSRRAHRAEAAAQAARNAEMERQLQLTRERRPWVLAACGALAAGVLISSALYVEARHDRDAARRQERIAEQTNAFLANDLLARSNPFKSGKAQETLVSAVVGAAPRIDRYFPAEPQVAAQLHQTIARALDRRDDWADARGEYERAARLWRGAGGVQALNAHTARLQLAMMEARSYSAGSLERARSILAEETQALAAVKAPGPQVPVWLASARGMVALVGNDAPQAAKEFAAAVKAADADPTDFDLGSRLTFVQRLAFAHIRLGDGAVAESLFRRLAGGYASLEGPDSADVLMVRLNLAQAYMIQGKHDQAVREANALYPKMLAVLGPEHELTLQLLSTRAQSEGALENWDAAIADTRAVHAVAVRTVGPGSFFGVASLTDGATAECRSGRLADGLRDVTEARAQANAAFAGSALENAVDFAWANCLILRGRFDEAQARLAGIKPAAVAQLAGDPDWGSNLDLARAQIALAKGRLQEARVELAAASPAMRKPTAEPYQVRLYGKLRAEAGL